MRFALIALALFVSADAFACPMADAAAYATAATVVQNTEGAKTAFTIAGLTCGSCSDKVTTALTAVDGVLAAAVDYQTGEAVIAFDEARTNPDALLAVITETGYAAEKKPQDS